MSNQAITLVFKTDIDPSTLLDIALQMGEIINQEIESHGENSIFIEDETSITEKEDQTRLKEIWDAVDRGCSESPDGTW